MILPNLPGIESASGEILTGINPASGEDPSGMGTVSGEDESGEDESGKESSSGAGMLWLLLTNLICSFFWNFCGVVISKWMLQWSRHAKSPRITKFLEISQHRSLICF